MAHRHTLHRNTVATLPCKMQKSNRGRLQ